MPTLFDPSIQEAAHPGSDTDRLYACQGSGADRDRWIERLDLFVDQMPNWAGGLGAPAHDAASPLDLTSKMLVLDKNGAPKASSIDFSGVRGYKVPSTGTYALKWSGATGPGALSDAGGAVVTGGVVSPRTGLTLSAVYPSSQGMYQATIAGMAVGNSSVVSSARQVVLEIAVDTGSTYPEDQVANLFRQNVNQLAGLSITDRHPIDACAFNEGSVFSERLYAQLYADATKIIIPFFKSSGADYTYADLHTLHGAYTYVFLRFRYAGIL